MGQRAPFFHRKKSFTERRIVAINNLTPGDFHVVAQKYSLAPEPASHEVLIAALQTESKHKSTSKAAGFIR